MAAEVSALHKQDQTYGSVYSDASNADEPKRPTCLRLTSSHLLPASSTDLASPRLVGEAVFARRIVSLGHRDPLSRMSLDEPGFQFPLEAR